MRPNVSQLSICHRMTDSVAEIQTVTKRTAGCGLDPARLVAARKKLDAMGMGIKEWCEQNGHLADYPLVRAILTGSKRCTRGRSHDIAVKLGLKDGEVVNG